MVAVVLAIVCLLAHAAWCWLCCVLVGPCCLVLAVLCACWPMLLGAGRAVCLLAHAAWCWPCCVLLCACRPMLLSAGSAMSLLAHAV